MSDRSHLRILLRHLSHAIAWTVWLLSVLILAIQGAHLPIHNHASRILALIVDPAEPEVLRLLELASSGCALVLHHFNGRLVYFRVFYSLVDRSGLPLILVHLIGAHLRLVADLTALSLVAVDAAVHVLHW